ncbi:L-histidine N(alpha)-methyltransferase, partial [Streptomyces sp. NPDC004976]
RPVWQGRTMPFDHNDHYHRLLLRQVPRNCGAAQTVKIPALGLALDFAAGEEVRTEVSAKFRQDGVRGELASAGLELTRWWTDEEQRFALSLSVAR